ncbi:vesicle-associated protein 4-1-like [Arabidopsis lyrata subsp. lyrata]|uniref:vesicle-associated protein 4-1-like n=1 Tax=Arabidopsis lyrata subsp. lyrata TaxID=81972 RepID=UPI000A29E7A2|nr:vesicle-associated protein 4-1-like [Arabidopsis lyrata subsp. lyrata]|eukprot:XP_020890010.1 vesicle-associated protein 4-1-like [Arabidopsis lyrata subsp. lyrata]
MFVERGSMLASDEEEYDLVREGVVIFTGALANHLAKDDPKVHNVVEKLLEVLNTPSESVKRAVTTCPSPLVLSKQEDAPALFLRLLDKLMKSDKYGERRGAAFGLAGVVMGFGISSLKKYGLIVTLQEALKLTELNSVEKKKKNLFRLCPFWQRRSTTSSSSSSTQDPNQNYRSRHGHRNTDVSPVSTPSLTMSSVARSLLPARRRLRLDPSSYLYFPYEPGKQVCSAIKLKNTSKSHTAFKFQTTAPKSCYMRPPGGVLAPGESVFATVFKFVEHPENNEKQKLNKKSKVKFKIISLKVKPGVEYVPELFDEQKDQVAVETGPRVVGEGLVIDEWKERREKYLARQQVEAIDSSSYVFFGDRAKGYVSLHRIAPS